MTKNDVIDKVREALNTWDSTGLDEILWSMMVELEEEQFSDVHSENIRCGQFTQQQAQEMHNALKDIATCCTEESTKEYASDVINSWRKQNERD